jgi:hypothetical protein
VSEQCRFCCKSPFALVIKISDDKLTDDRQFPFALPLFVIAGLDPAIQLLTKKMDPRVTMTGVQFKPIGIRSR